MVFVSNNNHSDNVLGYSSEIMYLKRKMTTARMTRTRTTKMRMTRTRLQGKDARQGWGHENEGQ